MNRWILLFVLLAAAISSAEMNAQNREDDPINRDIHNSFGASLIKNRKKVSRTLQIVRPRPQSYANEDDDVLRVETNLVVNEFLVHDQNGQAVRGLSQSDFRIEEDGEPQDIEFFSLGSAESAIPRTVVLLIDYSGSQLPYIETSISAATSLVEMLNPDDRLAIVTDDVELLTNFTSDKALLKEKLEMLKTRALSGNFGKSKQYSALMAAISELFQSEQLRPVIIFQTDGDQLTSLKRFGSNGVRFGDRNVDFGYEDIVESAEKAGITIYSIIPGIRLDLASGSELDELARKDLENAERSSAHMQKKEYKAGPRNYHPKFLAQWIKARIRDSAAIAEIAQRTCGWAEYLERPEQATAVYSRILSEMNQRYVIGYYPKNSARDGKRRSMKITVRSGRDYRIRGRSSYIAPGGE
jgi:VWFA-related protein